MNEALQAGAVPVALDFHSFREDRINNARQAKKAHYEQKAVNGKIVIEGQIYPLGRVLDELDEIYNEELEKAGFRYDMKKDEWIYVNA